MCEYHTQLDYVARLGHAFWESRAVGRAYYLELLILAELKEMRGRKTDMVRNYAIRYHWKVQSLVSWQLRLQSFLWMYFGHRLLMYCRSSYQFADRKAENLYPG